MRLQGQTPTRRRSKFLALEAPPVCVGPGQQSGPLDWELRPGARALTVMPSCSRNALTYKNERGRQNWIFLSVSFVRRWGKETIHHEAGESYQPGVGRSAVPKNNAHK